MKENHRKTGKWARGGRSQVEKKREESGRKVTVVSQKGRRKRGVRKSVGGQKVGGQEVGRKKAERKKVGRSEREKRVARKSKVKNRWQEKKTTRGRV